MPEKNNKLVNRKISATTQKYLDVSEIRDNVLIMKDATLRAILLVSSLNFSLKSEDEQNAIIAAYVSFLNNLEHPLQIVIQSREFKIDSYLVDLEKRRKEQTNPLLRIQTAEYLSYIKELISLGKIMNKRFYIVVSYNPLVNKKQGFFSRLLSVFKPLATIMINDAKFQERRKILISRVEHIASALQGMGLQSAMLDTQSIIELLYNTYNPETSTNEKLVDVNKLMEQ
ncbi:MAG: hypothetical protein Q8Q23_04895 [bacterium]|nr:hypothetical protein [bacterium]